MEKGFFIGIGFCSMPFFLGFFATRSQALLGLRLQRRLYLLVCLDNRESAYSSPLAPLLRHSGPLSQCCPFFRQMFLVMNLTRKAREHFLHQGRSLRYYMLNKNTVLHKILGYKLPISAIWVLQTININVNILMCYK